MKNVLIFCNTNYQLIVAVQIKLHNQGKFSLIVTDEIKNADKVVRNIKSTGLFENVCKIKVNEKRSKYSYLTGCIFGNIPKDIKNIVFDELIGFNMDIATHEVFAWLYRKNKNIVVNKMEEGLFSYDTPDTTCGTLDLSYRLRSILGLNNLKEIICGFYCFLPVAYKGKLKAIGIPKIKVGDETVKTVLNKIFVEGTIPEYKEKYILLSCIYDIEGGEPIGELDFALKLAETVGKDNLIVKVHPRDNAERYINAGLKVDKNSGIPWEVIQINNDFSDKILVTTLSGGIVNFNPVLEKVSKSYYGYYLCNMQGNPLATHYSEVLNGYLLDKNIGLRSIKILKDFEELKNE